MGKIEMIHASLIQLSALGYKEGDRVWIRCFAGKGFDVVKDRLFPFDGYLSLDSNSFSFTRFNAVNKGGGEKYTKQDGIGYLREQNAKGYGIYLIPNSGGRKDEEITKCPSLFFECDGIAKEEQLKRIDRLSIKPSLVIETRNSIHTYYRTIEDTPKEWRTYQKRLIQLMDSDPSIHNESRLMRLAGFDHQKAGSEPYPITILEVNDNIYTREQFDSLLPALDTTRWPQDREVITPQEREERLKNAKRRRETLLLSDGFPLEICISRANRELIDNGAGEGGRNNAGYALLVDLLATANYLTLAGYQYSGSPEALFDEFCDRCNPSISDRERQQIQRSASYGNHSPSLPPDAIENCIKAWQWNQSKDKGFEYKHTPEKIEKILDKYQKELSKQEQKEILINSFGKGGFGSLVSRTVRNIARRAKRKPYIPSKTSEENIIYIKWQEYDKIPAPDQYQGQKIKLVMQGLSNEQKSIHRKNVISLASRLGYKISLDTSHTGSGKSYLMGILNAQDFYLEKDDAPAKKHKLFYTSQTPDNATTAAIQKFTRLPSRNRGYLSGDKLNPLGEPQIHRAPIGHDIPKENLLGHPNCLLADNFARLRNHNQNSKGLCGTCPLLKQCQKGIGEDHGFLFEMFTTLANAENIRSSIVGLSPEMVQNNVIVHDEIGASYSPVTEVVIDKNQLLNDLTDAIGFDSEINAVSPSLLRLATLTSPDQKHKRYGYDTKECIHALGDTPEYIATIHASVKAFEEKDNERILTPNDDGKYPESKPRWFSTLLSIWISASSNRIIGDISVNHDNITVSIKNNHLADLTEVAHFSHFMDATTTPERLALSLGVEKTSIFHIEEEDPVINNLKIQPIDFGAMVNNDRSDYLVERVNLFRDSPTFKDVPVIEFKKYARPDDLIHGSDGRGSNAYESKDNLLLLGIYRKNMGGVLREYICLTGRLISIQDNDPDFAKYYEETNFAELIQEIGRLRGNRRINEKLTIYIADSEPLEGLKNFGYNVKPMVGVESFCPEAATRGKNTLHQVFRFFEEFLLSGITSAKEAIAKASKVTQKEVADFLGITVSGLKAIIGKLDCNWKAFTKSIVSLIYTPKGQVYFSESMTGCKLSVEDQAWMLSTYLPLMKSQYEGCEDQAWDEVKILLDDGILYAEGLSPEYAAWILYVVFRRLVSQSDLPILLNLLAPETEFA